MTFNLNQKSKLVQLMQVSTWLSDIAFPLQPIWLQTLFAINSELCQRLFSRDSFQAFSLLPSEVTLLFDWKLSRRSFHRQVIIANLLLMIEMLSEAMSTALVCNKVSLTPSKISFHIKKNQSTLRLLSQPEIYKLSKPFSIARAMALCDCCSQQLPQTLKCPVFQVCASQSSPPNLCLS